MPDDQENWTDICLERPRFHFTPPRGWMNDPCAPGYDPSTGLYNLMYQWNPHSHIWDNISWGQATSKDLIHWEYTSLEPVFVPDQPYDCKGIFTGCLYPTSPSGGRGLSIFYTSVPYLPIHWSTPHRRGAEGVSLITSEDGGKSWLKSPNNPIISAEPSRLSVTGFRDPFIAANSQLSTLLNHAPDQLYALVSGGVQSGPRLFLYSVNPNDLTQWTFLQTLCNDIPRDRLKGGLEYAVGDFGKNWECASFFTLIDVEKGEERMVWMVGVEGGRVQKHVKEYRAENPRRIERGAMYFNWFFGDITRDTANGEGVEVDLGMGAEGMLDHGEFYAASTFLSKDGRRLVWGWFCDFDVDEDVLVRKGWTGCLGVLREVYLLVVDGVVGLSGGGELEDLPGYDVEGGEEEGGRRVITLGIRPAIEVESLRKRLVYSSDQDASILQTGVIPSLPSSYTLHLAVRPDLESRFILHIRQSPMNPQHRTSIIYDPSTSSFSIDRSNSTTRSDINTQSEISRLNLLKLYSGGKVEAETLMLKVYVDADTVEVFVNERVAFATRVYSPIGWSGVSLESGEWRIEGLQVWEMGSMGLTEQLGVI